MYLINKQAINQHHFHEISLCIPFKVVVTVTAAATYTCSDDALLRKTCLHTPTHTRQ